MSDEFRLGIVGLGGIAVNAHGPAIKRSRAGIRFTACCDVRPEAMKRWADAYGSTGYTDCQEMVRTERLDGVLLATWPNQHREQIEMLLAAGVRNILCEKALTLTGKEAVEIYDLVVGAGAFLMEGFMYRHNPVIRKLEQLLSWGHLGAVDNARACFSAYDPETADPADPNRDWRQRKECGGGIPYDFACYAVNFCGHFAGGLPERAYCVGDVGKYGTINRVHGLLSYDNGVSATIESSKKSSFTQEAQISCANGILNLPIAWTIDRNMTITQRHTGWNNTTYDAHVSDGVTDGLLSYQLQAENFVAVARGEATPVIPLAESVVNTFALEALVTSVLEKRAMDIAVPKHIEDACRTHATGNRKGAPS
jgi:predicted dehydrogenase